MREFFATSTSFFMCVFSFCFFVLFCVYHHYHPFLFSGAQIYDYPNITLKQEGRGSKEAGAGQCQALCVPFSPELFAANRIQLCPGLCADC